MGNLKSKSDEKILEIKNINQNKEKESIGKNLNENAYNSEGIEIKLILLEFNTNTFNIKYQITIENKNEESILIKQIQKEKNVPWWRNFYLKIIFTKENEKNIIKLCEFVNDFTETNNKKIYEEYLDNLKYLTIPAKQKLISNIIEYDLIDSMNTSQIELLNEISNLKNIEIVAELYEIKTQISDKNLFIFQNWNGKIVQSQSIII
jgi:hypothetical protein